MDITDQEKHGLIYFKAARRHPHPYIVIVTGYDQLDIEKEMTAWCIDTFGPLATPRWDMDYPPPVYLFRDQADAMLFVLKWQ